MTNNPDIHCGLELFTAPGGDSCVVASTLQVAIAADNAAAIKAEQAGITTENATTTALASALANDYLKSINDGSSKAILLATDGEPDCGSSGGGRGGGGSSDQQGAANAVAAAFQAGFAA